MKTKNIYHLPLPKSAKITEARHEDSAGHPKPYETAIDFAVEVGTDVLAPLDGSIITVLSKHFTYGSSF